MPRVDVIIHSAVQLVTCAAPEGKKRGPALSDVEIIADGAVAISDGLVALTGKTEDVLAAYSADREIDASGLVVCPGFVDPHTHVVYAGDRIDEFEMRTRGVSYMEILNAGGGILSTVRATREATASELAQESRSRLDAMLALGTTTVEVKSGYGLDVDSELKILQAVELLHKTHPIDLVPTFLGAHAVPPEYKGRTDEYTDLVIEKMIPAASEWYSQSVFAAEGIPLFCDVFCEENVFDRSQSERILRAGLSCGMTAKIHADEFKSLGGVSLAVELESASVDHLDVTEPADWGHLARSNVVGVVLPAVNFNFGATQFAAARELIDAGGLLALATDINPGSAPCPSMPMVMAIACRYQRLLPGEALNASTINAACAIALGDRVGSIEEGKQADMLLLQASDYRYLSYEFGSNLVVGVLKSGKFAYCKPSHLNRFSTIS